MELFDVYSLYPVEPVRGSGSYVYDAAGTEYLDLYGGHAVISIGHAHPHYVRMISEQAARLGFYSNSVENSLQHTLAERLGALSGYDDYRLFLCNSGAEANENALKLASFHTGRAKVLAFGGAFHGRTSGAVEVTDNPAIRSPFNATANVEFVPLNDIGAVERKLAAREFAAVIVEGIQGVAGIRCPEEEFLRALREATERTGTVLILDEIQSGYGRTGRFFAHQWAGIRPDLIRLPRAWATASRSAAYSSRRSSRPARGCWAPPSAATIWPARRRSPWPIRSRPRGWSRTPAGWVTACSNVCARCPRCTTCADAA